MSEVWKFPLAITGEQTVPMPDSAQLLHVAEQDRTLCLWARVNPTEPLVDRLILIRGTGHPAGNEPYVGSVVTSYGQLVWHVFDGGVAA